MVQVGNLVMTRCACGSGIVVAFPTPRIVELAVQRHQQTRFHQGWWEVTQWKWQGMPTTLRQLNGYR